MISHKAESQRGVHRTQWSAEKGQARMQSSAMQAFLVQEAVRWTGKQVPKSRA